MYRSQRNLIFFKLMMKYAEFSENVVLLSDQIDKFYVRT